MKADYDRQRAEDIARWAAAPPTLVARGFGRALAPASAAAQALVPVPVLRKILGGSHSLTRWQFHTRLPQPSAGENLEECDRHARRVERQAMSVAGGLGAATGVGGAWAVAADIPLLLALALAAIERTALCYGIDVSEAPPELAIGIFALASANTAEEKRFALRALDSDPSTLVDAAARDGLERAAQRQLAKDTAQLSLTQLARQLGRNFGQRKLGQMVPIIGSAIGLTVNAMYLRDVCRAAQNVFGLRYLLGPALAEPESAILRRLPDPESAPENSESLATDAVDENATRGST